MKKKEIMRMPKIIPIETKQQAIRLYKNKDMSVPEIANLLGVSIPTLAHIYNVAFEKGILTPRRPEIALKPRTPNGQGKDRKPTGRKRGNPHWGENKKFSEEQELQIAEDYYVNGLSTSEIKKKWNCHPMQLQRVREKFGEQYGKKNYGRNANKDYHSNDIAEDSYKNITKNKENQER